MDIHNVNRLLNLLKGQTAGSFNSMAFTRIGTVDEYNPALYRASVRIQPENIKTDLLPILTPWVGNNWGFYTGLNNGDAVCVLFLAGNFSSGIICLGLNNIENKPVTDGPPAGEAWMQHKTGTYLKFLTDGTIEIKTLDGDENKTNININSNIVVTGNITCTGDILDNSGTNANNIAAMRTIFNEHIHPTPSGDSDIPTTQM
ncbi:hypothetical protein AQUSIP_12850 [Aquicella siphonis]|uniref:Gp5/Type VI secretion system Vgr protein OB-fold domain-containing protein n=1 Tax=Aquicella siphonis TaxID=254247 RepID=A0A5E4PGI4_9COXI|nr:hypothetical protein [Aquicella siphonis]VVC75984.1 hypothetical protein AQUSIP_12850 [Aquicella siphonis]